MKSMQKIVKTNFKFVPILLALIVSFLIFKDCYSENSLISKQDVKEAFIADEPMKRPNDSVFFFVTSIVLKCSLAFLFGGWISDRKFIFAGAIWFVNGEVESMLVLNSIPMWKTIKNEEWFYVWTKKN